MVRAVRGPHNFLGPFVAQPAPTNFRTKVVIASYSPNPSCLPNLKLLASTVAGKTVGPKFFECCPSPESRQFGGNSCFFDKLLTKRKLCTKSEFASFNGCRNK